MFFKTLNARKLHIIDRSNNNYATLYNNYTHSYVGVIIMYNKTNEGCWVMCKKEK